MNRSIRVFARHVSCITFSARNFGNRLGEWSLRWMILPVRWIPHKLLHNSLEIGAAALIHRFFENVMLPGRMIWYGKLFKLGLKGGRLEVAAQVVLRDWIQRWVIGWIGLLALPVTSFMVCIELWDLMLEGSWCKCDLKIILEINKRENIKQWKHVLMKMSLQCSLINDKD